MFDEGLLSGPVSRIKWSDNKIRNCETCSKVP
jgi:hypothetical protein